MRLLFGIVSIATVPVWLGVHVNSAAAQNFNDRWSTEPAPEAIEQNPLERPPTRVEPTRRSKGRSASRASNPTYKYRKSAVLARPLRTARTYVAPQQIPSHCPLTSPTQAQVDAATNECVNTLTRSAQFLDCFFEDDAGRGEDKRTGLSCPDRQAALAKQCLKRCANYASDTTHLVCTGSYPNTVWHISFGDISDNTGYARVDRCGPPLRSTFAKKPPLG
jgi:hypothetical protein